MPLSVRIALALIGAQALVPLFDMWRIWSTLQSAGGSDITRYAVLGGVVGSQALTIGLIAGMAWRKHWARMGWLILTLIALATLFTAVVELRSRGICRKLPHPVATTRWRKL